MIWVCLGRYRILTHRNFKAIIQAFNFRIRFYTFSDIFKVGKRSESVKTEDQRFQHLRKFLPTFCLKVRADNTLNQYRYTFKAFCRCCDAFIPPISSLPAAEEYVALYIISLAKDSKSSSKIQSSIHAISWTF